MGADAKRFIATEGRYAGRECWYFPHSGRVFPVVRGGDGSGDAGTGEAGAGGTGGEGTGAGGGEGEGTEPKTFTQDEVNRRLTEEKRQGERHARRTILEQLGLDPNDSTLDLGNISETLKAAREREEQEKSELQRKTDEAQREKDAASREKADAKRETLKAKVTLAVVRAGAPADSADDVSTLVRAELEDNADPTDEDVTAAVAAVKERQAKLFEAATETNGDGKGPGGKVTTPKAPSSQPQGKSQAQAGDDTLTSASERAAARYAPQPAPTG